MSETLSLNTKAILLLTAPLIAGKNKENVKPFTAGEYERLARRLKENQAEPADLLKPAADTLRDACGAAVDKARLAALLGRGFLLSQAVERWQTRAIWVVSRADDAYPRMLKERLKKHAPVLLYGCGRQEIVNTPGALAIVGSRKANESLLEYARGAAVLAAGARRNVVSGGARGVDLAAMKGALETGGKVVGVLAGDLESTSMNRDHRNRIREGRLALISPYDPRARFHPGHAMQRNKVIYGLADAALVVNADPNKGGTWNGSIEQLEKLRATPVYVRSTGEASEGLIALEKKGALRWPNPQDAAGLAAAFRAAASQAPSVPAQGGLPFRVEQNPKKPGRQKEARPERRKPTGTPTSGSAEKLQETVRALILRILTKPKNAAEVAAELDVTKGQAQDWIKRLVAEGVLEKQTKPVRYVVQRNGDFFPEKSRPRSAEATGGAVRAPSPI